MSTPIFTVTELTKYIKHIIVKDHILKNVYVRGEVSNYSQAASGHCYFTIKDKKSRIKCVMFRDKRRLLNFCPQDGMKVIANGSINVYERDGQYQLYVQDLQPDGLGSLYLAYLQLKERLEQEGLFDQRNKKQIPDFPLNIGVVTSPTGAAIKDIISVIKRRYPYANIIISPTSVQGEKAPKEIVAALKRLNKLDYVDVIIVSRGGGSIEELWAFNDEDVARCIYASEKPVISAVGHERDFTISDFVADLRAPTPSAAGEIVVPDTRELINQINNFKKRLLNGINNQLYNKKNSLYTIYNTKVFKRSEELFYSYKLRLDFVTKELLNNMQKITEHRKRKFGLYSQKLEVLNPLKILNRGYSIAFKNGRVIKTADDINIDDNVNIKLSKGILRCKVLSRLKEEKLDDL